jgi:hypothetical protein
MATVEKKKIIKPPKPLRGGTTDTSPPPPPTPKEKPKKPEDPQKVLDSLVLQHGANFSQWADYPEILKKANLQPDKITPDMLRLSAHRAKRSKGDSPPTTKQEEPTHTPRGTTNNSILTFPTEHVEAENKWGISKYQEWISECGRYKASRVTGTSSGDEGISDHYFFASFWRVIPDRVNGKGEIVRGHQYWDSCFSDDKMGSGYPKHYGTLTTSFEAILKKHKELHLLNDVQTNCDRVIALAVEKGLDVPYRACPTQPRGKRTPVTEKLPKQPGEVVVRKTKVGGEGRDRCGCRLSSQAAAINAALTAEPKSVEQIMFDSKQEKGRVKSHLKWMLERGYAVEKGGRYVEGKFSS